MCYAFIYIKNAIPWAEIMNKMFGNIQRRETMSIMLWYMNLRWKVEKRKRTIWIQDVNIFNRL